MIPETINLIIADDDNDDVELFQEAVNDTCPEIKLTVASDGGELIHLLDEIPKPDVILLDLNMPFKSGKECLEEIRSKGEFDNVPVIIFTTSNNKEDIDYCKKNGANHYYVKPDSFAGMKRIVNNICQKDFGKSPSFFG